MLLQHCCSYNCSYQIVLTFTDSELFSHHSYVCSCQVDEKPESQRNKCPRFQAGNLGITDDISGTDIRSELGHHPTCWEPTTDMSIGPRMRMWQICIENLHSVDFTGAIAAKWLIDWLSQSNQLCYLYHWGLFQIRWRSSAESRPLPARRCGTWWPCNAMFGRSLPNDSCAHRTYWIYFGSFNHGIQWKVLIVYVKVSNHATS